MATDYYLLAHKNTAGYPQCGYPRRGGAKASGTIILHDAEGGTDLSGVDMGAENVANFIRTRGSYGSYHRLVDRDTRIKMAPIDYETWHSVPDNPWTVGICVAWNKADLSKMTRAQRESYYVPLALEVLDVRAEFAERGITVPIDRMLTAAETQARKPGISTHSRTDPSRRSDPFGTNSVYEREFLAVLAGLAKSPTPTPMKEFLMTLSDRDQTAVLWNARQAKANTDELVVLSQKQSASIASLSAAVRALAETRGVDGDALVASVSKAAADAATKALEGAFTITVEPADTTEV